MNTKATGVLLFLILATASAGATACRSRELARRPKPPTLEVPSYTRTKLPFPKGWWPTAAAAGDIDGDGQVDIAAIGQRQPDGESNEGHEGILRLYLLSPGQGYGAHDLTVPRDVHALILADINQDGAPDILTANGSSKSISVFYGVARGGFRPRIDWNIERTVTALAATDLDGDARPDLVALTQDGSVGIGHNDGTGTFDHWLYYVGDHVASGLVVADADGDGTMDLLIPQSEGGTIALLLQRETGQFEKARPADIAGRHATGAAVADFNHDGITDIAVPVFERGSVHVLLGSGQGRFRLWRRLGVGPAPRHIATADLNQDDLADLIVTTNSPDHLILLYGTHNGGFASVRPLPADSRPIATVAADLNGDGFPDLAIVNSEANFITLLTSNSNRPWKAPSTPEGPFGGGRTVSGTAPLYDDAIAAFKQGTYFEALRRLRRLYSGLSPEFVGGRIGDGKREEDRQIYIASVLLISDIYRYYTGDPRAARDIELKLAADAVELGQMALAAAEYLSVADIERAELNNEVGSIQALVRLEELVRDQSQGEGVPPLLADMAKLRIDRLHQGMKGYRARLPILSLPYPNMISASLLLRVVLPHLDAYGEPSSGPALYEAFKNTHPRSFRAVVAEYLGLREKLSVADVANARSLSHEFSKQNEEALLAPIVAGDVLARLRRLGEKGAEAWMVESIHNAVTELGVRVSIRPPE